MEGSISVLFYNLAGLFVLVGVGFLTVRTGLIPASASGTFSALLMNVAMPTTIFVSMLRPFESSFLRESLTLIFMGFLFIPILLMLTHLGRKVFKIPVGRQGTWRYCSTYPNSSAMGFPVISALFGERGLALAVMLNIPINLLIYTQGSKMVSGDHAAGGPAVEMSWRKILFSPVNVSMVLGLLFYCLQIPLPDAVQMPLKQLAAVTTPLAMMTIGITLAKGRWRDVVEDRNVHSAAVMRLVVAPLVAWVLLAVLSVSEPAMRGAFLIIMAMPAPVVSGVVAEQYGGDRELAARTVFFTSLLCILTTPLVVMLL